ncbi:MAG: hypothetical protein LBT21_08055 [Oscillospiraceae bacterium]|jgi:hypothetical protein|nr:hypothetical protein [Oscillospiraceae bacterium]
MRDIEQQKMDVRRVSGLTKFPLQRLAYVMDSVNSLKSDVECLRRNNEQNLGEEDKVNSIRRCLDQVVLEVDRAMKNIEQIVPGINEYISYISG